MSRGMMYSCDFVHRRATCAITSGVVICCGGSVEAGVGGWVGEWGGRGEHVLAPLEKRGAANAAMSRSPPKNDSTFASNSCETFSSVCETSNESLRFGCKQLAWQWHAWASFLPRQETCYSQTEYTTLVPIMSYWEHM